VGGREVYRNILHVMYHIIKKKGVDDLYRNLRPSCIKVMPTTGISFMCYESLKKILVEGEEEVRVMLTRRNHMIGVLTLNIFVFND
jgi:solute carrier family 25 (mitochondrial phosphate transporter), member 23/24/25/41